MKLIAGNSNTPLAEAIADYLEIPLTRANVRRFADEEIFVEVLENVRGEDVFVLQSTSYPANDNLMELLIIVDALKRASAKRITVVMPYYPYSRQDKKGRGREPISARLVADLFKTAGADRIMPIDIHAAQIQGFFDGPFDHLFAMPVLLEHFQRSLDPATLTVVSPDMGRVRVADVWSDKLGAPLAIIHKRRDPLVPNQVSVHDIVGNVDGRARRVEDVGLQRDFDARRVDRRDHLRKQGTCTFEQLDVVRLLRRRQGGGATEFQTRPKAAGGPTAGTSRARAALRCRAASGRAHRRGRAARSAAAPDRSRSAATVHARTRSTRSRRANA